MQVPKLQTPYVEAWHLWTVIIPRRSITGRLLWGTVLRRRNNSRWIYKKYAKSVGIKEYLASARALFKECKKAASYAGRGMRL
jgi:hypothetical protein